MKVSMEKEYTRSWIFLIILLCAKSYKLGDEAIFWGCTLHCWGGCNLHKK